MRCSSLAIALAVTICSASADAFPKRESRAVAVFKELELPPPLPLGSLIDRKAYETFPTDESKLRVYGDTGPTFAQIEKEPGKFAKDYPLRSAAVEAIVAIRGLDQSFPVTFADPIDNAAKKKITDTVQRKIAENQGILAELQENLDMANKNRDDEASLRWQATFDFVRAQVKLRLALVLEYNLALGNIKTEKLPALDPAQNHDGWQLVAVEKMKSPVDIRKLADEAKVLFEKIIERHPGTPWAELSTRDKNIPTGLKWQSVKLEKSK